MNSKIANAPCNHQTNVGVITLGKVSTIDCFQDVLCELRKRIRNFDLKPRGRSIKTVQVLPPLEQPSADDKYAFEDRITIENAMVERGNANFVDFECPGKTLDAIFVSLLRVSLFQQDSRCNTSHMRHTDEHSCMRSNAFQVFNSGRSRSNGKNSHNSSCAEMSISSSPCNP